MPEFLNITKINAAVDNISADVCERILLKIQDVGLTVAQGQDFNMLRYFETDSDFVILRDALINAGRALLLDSGNTEDDLSIDRMWVNIYGDDDYIQPHYHFRSMVTGIVYLDVDQGAGDLLIQDPLAGYHWTNRKSKSGRYDSQASISISPSTGMLLVMPGFIVHSTEPKVKGKSRIILATNFNIFNKGDSK
jgi:uncharacterized protein (TIGR02466 family)